MSSPDLPEDDELLATELALGLLAGEERARAEARLGEPAFRAAHARWLEYAVTMEEVRPQAPSPAVWRRIEAALPANENRAGGSLRWWQASTAIASIAAIMLAAIVLRAPPPVPLAPAQQQRPAPPLVAVLVGDKDNGAIAVSYDPVRGNLTLMPTRLAMNARAAELWVIPADGKPRSLGVIPEQGVLTRTPRPDLARIIAPGVTLAISAEPAGGSPTGQPTGPVLYSGKFLSADASGVIPAA